MSAPCPEFGFDIMFRLAPGLSESERDAVWTGFVRAVEARGLSAGGGGDVVWTHTVAREGGQAIDADREALRGWAEAQAGIVEVRVGPLIDLNLAAG